MIYVILCIIIVNKHNKHIATYKFPVIYYQCNPHNGPNKQQYKTVKKPRLRRRTDRAWFSRLLRHPVMKRRGSILTSPEPARGN